ncbi:MAG: YfhO family protein [Deltaproteobacteria bacterium]|nr:YfhO family protein [Deltaproteobacteria bacterium]
MSKRRLVHLKEDVLPLILFIILPVLSLNGALFSAANILGSPYADIKVELYSKLYGYNELLNLSTPLWNPYRFSGMPYVATLHPAIFYPFNLLFLILPVNQAINWGIAFHLVLSGSFIYYLLKYYGINRFGSTVGGIVYMFAAPHVMHIYAGHFIVLNAMIWTPLMFLLLDRFIKGEGLQYGVLLSFTIAFQFLAGQPQYLFYSLISLMLYLIFLLIQLRIDGAGYGKIYTKVLAFAAFIILGLALSAVQILPTVEMTKDSTRENLTYEWVSIFSFPSENLITFMIPDFFGDMIKVAYWGKNYLWEMSAYVGIMPLILAVMAFFHARRRVVWFFSGLAVVSLILAFGKYTPLLKLLYTHAPGFNLFRGNSKWIFLNAFSLAVLSGFGADAIANHVDHIKNRFRIGVAGFALIAVSGLIFMYAIFDETWFREAIGKSVYSGDFFNNPEPFMQRGFEAFAAASFRDGFLWAMALLMSGSAALLLYSYGILKEKAFKVSLLAIIVFDLFSFGMRYMVTFDSKEVYWDKEVVSFLKQDKEPFRVIAPEMDANSGMASGIETLGGYDTIMLKRYSEFINLSQGLLPGKPNLSMDIKSINKRTDLLNARYLVLQSGPSVNNPAFRSVFDNGRYRIYKNMNAMPRAFVVHAAKVINDRDSIFREMVGPEFNPAYLAIIEEEPDIPLNKPTNVSPVPRFMEYYPNRVIMEASLTEPGLLVLGDVYYPGWKAYVDGKETKVYRANYIMRAVALREGRHMVEFRYEPLSFKLGATISLATLFLMAGFLVWDWRRSEAPKNAT